MGSSPAKQSQVFDFDDTTVSDDDFGPKKPTGPVATEKPFDYEKQRKEIEAMASGIKSDSAYIQSGLGSPKSGERINVEEFKAVKNKPLKPIKKEILSSRVTTMGKFHKIMPKPPEVEIPPGK
tara:strand:- start:808 stop:1176 length:369 start_codon:yes stop_codon:yes gene_type:complete